MKVVVVAAAAVIAIVATVIVVNPFGWTEKEGIHTSGDGGINIPFLPKGLRNNKIYYYNDKKTTYNTR